VKQHPFLKKLLSFIANMFIISYQNYFLRHPEKRSAMNEKRKEERILKQTKAEVHYGDGMTFSTSIDISSAGIFISTPEPLTTGEKIKLAIQTSDGNFIKVDGIVRWNNCEGEYNYDRLGMGVEFIAIPPDELKKINALLN